ncbi:MAG: glycosyltransferase family 4 protein [Candidatus Nitrotoga sp.]
MKSRPWRIAVLNSHPIQYFAPLYAYLNASEDFDITALYCSDFSLRGAQDPGFGQNVTWDLDLLAGYRAVFLGERAKTRTPGGFWSLVCPEVWREVRSGRYDALILHGHNYAVNLLALLSAKTAGVKVFMRGETHLGLQRSDFMQRIRRPLMNLLYRACDCCLAIGAANHAFYRAMGVPEHKIVTVPYTVDNDRFIAAARLGDQERRDMLQRLGADTDQPVVLYASKFQRRKHPDDLLKAVALLRERGIRCTVLMVGSGEMRDELRQLVTQLNLSDVHFTGFINQSDLPRVYGASDIFVLPSENEPWGLIVNEVMCAALPVIIAEEVGCVRDLVYAGINGYTFPAKDPIALADCLEKLLSNPDQRKAMGRESLARICNWSYRECHLGLKNALEDGFS